MVGGNSNPYLVPIQVWFMARRHRILESEARYVMKVVHYRLEALAKEQGVGEEAQELFRVCGGSTGT